MINLTDKEFSEVIGEVFKEVKEKDSDIALFVLVFRSMIGAKAEMKTEEKEAEEKKKEYEAIVEYRAGRWIIRISTLESDKVRLRIYRDDVAVCDRTLDSLYKAYNYAFNIISL